MTAPSRPGQLHFLSNKFGETIMHMNGQDERRFAVKITHQERYQFLSEASEAGRAHGAPYLSDEPEPVGDSAEPSTPALLASAIGHCLSASLLECLRHARVDVLACTADAVAVVRPNAEGNPRIDHVEVTIRPHVSYGMHTSCCHEESRRVFHRMPCSILSIRNIQPAIIGMEPYPLCSDKRLIS